MRRTRLVCLAVCAALVVTACSSQVGGTAGADPAVAPPPELPAAELARAIATRLAGTTSARFQVDTATSLPALSAKSSLSGQFRRDAQGYWASAKISDATELVFTPGTLFVRPPAEAKLPADKPWVRVGATDTSEFAKQFQPVFAALQRAGQPPVELAATKLVRSEVQALNGLVPTRHYVLEVDLAAAAKAATDPDTRQGLLAELQLGATALAEELWVAAGNVPLRATSTLALPDRPQAVQVTTTYTDWDKPVQITPPPDSQLSPQPG
ncbi:hypothetical protein KALB_7878 [Kutzneria albida DSM 43870]|uniref:Secreted protein n=1 Tax=Kutzneria albida DSM 43870 TaxID=1449976 RepID=W5WKE9_9PSEU|nr:hypothetical protein KALB_7878 [Kutzneria albida DSM 43870]